VGQGIDVDNIGFLEIDESLDQSKTSSSEGRFYIIELAKVSY
jgi:hypothetical protein